MTYADRFLVIDAQGARHEGVQIAGSTPYQGAPLARGASVSTELERTENSYQYEGDSVGILSHDAKTDVLVLADAATPARLTLRSVEAYVRRTIAVAAGAANTATLYCFGCSTPDSWSRYADVAVGIDQLAVLEGKHPHSVKLEYRDTTTTAQLISALGTLSHAGVELVLLHRMKGWGALGPHKTVALSDVGDDVIGDPKTVDIGDPRVDVTLSPTGVASALEDYAPRFLYCFEARARPRLHGSVQLAFDVTADGDIRNASASGLDAKIASCVAGAIFDLDIAPIAVNGAGHARVSITFPGAADDGSAVSGFWCFQGRDYGLCAHEEAQCQAALDAGNRAAASLQDSPIDSPCRPQPTAWTKDGEHWDPTKKLCGATCKEVH